MNPTSFFFLNLELHIYFINDLKYQRQKMSRNKVPTCPSFCLWRNLKYASKGHINSLDITHRIQDGTFTILGFFKKLQFISIKTLILPLPCSISSRFLFLRSWSKKSSLYDGRCLYSTSQQPNLHQCKIKINQRNIKQLC